MTSTSTTTHLVGSVHRPGEPGYDAARAAWNLNADHRPAVAVLPADADDVAAAVRLGRETGQGVGVLATGHGSTRTVEGGVLVNTSRMRAVRVDAARRVARVEAGVVWSDLIAATAPYGLSGLPGSSANVGVVGFSLGGGFGWLGRRYGLASQSLTRAELVTADGRQVVASPAENAELFWGLGGGTDNFGIVTALELALHPVPLVYGGNLYYPLERARELLEFHGQWGRSAPVELTSAVTFRSFPPLPALPAALRGRSLVALRGAWCGDPCDGEDLLDQARDALGPATLDTFTRMPASAMASISLDPVEPLGAVSRTELVRSLTGEAVEVLLDLAGPGSASPLVMLELRQLGGAIAGSSGVLSPIAHTEAAYSLNAIGLTRTPAEASVVRRHLRALADALQGHVTGETYLNFLDGDGATPERVRAAYSASDWTRLVALKHRYDPDNVFRFNRNIPPT